MGDLISGNIDISLGNNTNKKQNGEKTNKNKRQKNKSCVLIVVCNIFSFKLFKKTEFVKQYNIQNKTTNLKEL